MGKMNVAERITLGDRKGTVAYFDDNLKLSDEKKATIAKVVFDDGGVEFFVIQPAKPK